MKSTANKPHVRARTSFTADPALLAEARSLGVNISRAAETGIAQEVKKAREAQWRAENAEAIKSSNAYFEKHGLPLAKYRQF